ncbi:unnamed protein product [Arctia plantaginis]|uniref:Uncharacterized protein n=1 Tax=Arctia plantaginis TaxID=874455 RepID=A0A8S0ZAZ5_ARCPL|nr:unnamed protein product [Arctia plantaginis]
MSCENDKLVLLKLKLKHEREVLKLRNKERSLTDDLSSLKREIDYLTEQLEASQLKSILKRQLTQNKHQISLIEICTSLENVKNEDHINVLNGHLKSFQELFDKGPAAFVVSILRTREMLEIGSAVGELEIGRGADVLGDYVVSRKVEYEENASHIFSPDVMTWLL